MKITISNLGAVKHAEIDLKPLTILVGANNAGKSWLIYTLAAALSNYSLRQYIAAYVTNSTPEKYTKLDAIVEQIVSNGVGVLDIVQFINEDGERSIRDIVQLTKSWLDDFFGTDSIILNTFEINIDVTDIKDPLQRKMRDITIKNSIGRKNDEEAPLRALKGPGESKLFFYPGQNITEQLPDTVIKEFVAGVVFSAIIRYFYPYTYFFPTERAGLMNDQLFLTSTRNSGTTVESIDDDLSSILSKSQLKLRPQPQPIADFLSTMFRLRRRGSFKKRQKQAQEKPLIQQYMHLADILQEEILDGKLDFSTAEPDPAKARDIRFSPMLSPDSTPLDLEMRVTSSMVKDLSLLVLYLRYEAQPGELLVIDEPEMNLHPAAQLKMIEFLAMLVNAGLHVFITTHSPYVVDHLNNLLDAYKHIDQDKITGKFLLERKDAFIDQKKVSIYLIDEGVAKNILNSAGDIAWDTFSSVTRIVERIHFELLED